MFSSLLFLLCHGAFVISALSLLGALGLLMDLLKVGSPLNRHAYAAMAFKMGWISLGASIPLWILAHIVKVIEHVLGAVMGAI